MAQFSNVIVHGTINSAQGDLHINNRDSEVGLHTLRQGVSLGAIHDSAERYPPPNCHPDTRKAVRQIILDWIHNESSASPFFWLYGPAGAGKTAILQAIAEFLCSPSGSDENFGASFFFSRGKSGRDQGHFLFPTIAYQLALRVPGLRQHLNRTMEANPTLHTKSIAGQLQTLIVDAFQSLSPLPQRSYLVIIDGLDECQDKATQQSILQLLCDTNTDRKLPLRFLIGSRPESQIRTSFDQKSLYTITQRVVLDETFNPGRDIEVFLQDGFATICAKNADILPHVKQPWLEKGIIDLLVQRSSGQFIYAATVLKFVGADFCNPTKQLALILKPDPSAFSDLDQLYTQILSVYPSTADIVQVLGILIVFDTRTLTPEVIGDILEMEEGDVTLVLRCLSSLTAFVEDKNDGYEREKTGSIYFTHASFSDYLVDPSRSGPFHVNKSEYKNQATLRCFSLIFKSIGRSWRIPPTRIPHSETWHYFERYLADHFVSSPKESKDAIMADIHDLVQEFWKISRSRAVDISFPAICCLVAIFRPQIFSRDPGSPGIYRNAVAQVLDKTKSKHVRIIHGFPKMLDQSLRTSSELGDLLRFLPGIVVQKRLTMQGMAELYRVNMDVVERLVVFNNALVSRSEVDSHSRYYTLAGYLVSFLQDRKRSQLYYCDPILHHTFISRHFLSLLDRLANACDFDPPDELRAFVESHLPQHLFVAAENFLSIQNVPVDHPVVQILNGLESITYGYDNASWSYGRGHLMRCCASGVLRWANMLISRLKGVAVPNSDLIQRMCQLTHKIYREILCIEVDSSTMIVALIGLTPESNRRNIRKTLGHWAVIQVSWKLLRFVSVQGVILSSFTDFITTPEISGAFYISPDVYHTQITEYSLETLYQDKHNYQVSPFTSYLGGAVNLECKFEEHISQALPTEMIFYLLCSIPSSCFINNHEGSSIIGILGTIIKWLEGLGSEQPVDLYNHFQLELRQRKKPVLCLPPQVLSGYKWIRAVLIRIQAYLIRIRAYLNIFRAFRAYPSNSDDII